jgi:hypothetical protein
MIGVNVLTYKTSGLNNYLKLEKSLQFPKFPVGRRF